MAGIVEARFQASRAQGHNSDRLFALPLTYRKPCRVPLSADFDVVARVARLCVYPVKSCAGIDLQSALLTDTGLQWDRAWMVVDAQGHCLTQRTLPRMALVQPQLQPQEGALLLHAPGQPTLSVPLAPSGACRAVQVWDDRVQALDAGDAAAAWFSAFLCQPCRLVRFDPAGRRLASADWTAGLQAPFQFADAFPLLVASMAGLDALNAQLAAVGEAAAGMERFRPNLVLGGVDAHEEDWLDLLHIPTAGADADANANANANADSVTDANTDANTDGDADSNAAVQLLLTKPCVRCPIPDIDPVSAQPGTQVGDALRRYRQDARMGGALTFGMNAVVQAGAGQVLRVGQPLGARYHFA